MTIHSENDMHCIYIQVHVANVAMTAADTVQRMHTCLIGLYINYLGARRKVCACAQTSKQQILLHAARMHQAFCLQMYTREHVHQEPTVSYLPYGLLGTCVRSFGCVQVQ